MNILRSFTDNKYPKMNNFYNINVKSYDKKI